MFPERDLPDLPDLPEVLPGARLRFIAAKTPGEGNGAAPRLRTAALGWVAVGTVSAEVKLIPRKCVPKCPVSFGFLSER